MPILLDNEPRDETVLRAHDTCDWQVVELLRGRVALMTASSLMAPTFTVTFTTAALPQLKKAVELLEKDQPKS